MGPPCRDAYPPRPSSTVTGSATSSSSRSGIVKSGFKMVCTTLAPSRRLDMDTTKPLKIGIRGGGDIPRPEPVGRRYDHTMRPRPRSVHVPMGSSTRRGLPRYTKRPIDDVQPSKTYTKRMKCQNVENNRFLHKGSPCRTRRARRKCQNTPSRWERPRSLRVELTSRPETCRTPRSSNER